MSTQHVRYVLCDANHHDVTIGDHGPLHAVGIQHRTMKQALRMEGSYLKENPQAFLAKITYERIPTDLDSLQGKNRVMACG